MSCSAGVAFFAEVVVTDSDDLDKAYHFILADASHGACFNIGLSAAGAILISWSQLHSLYQLPDGSKWAEATNLIDREDLVRLSLESTCSVYDIFLLLLGIHQ